VPVTALLAALAAALSAASPPWALPVPGPVAAGFRYDPARPFAAGARRGVDLRAAARSPVRAACSGRVTHAGAVPRWAVGVSLRCGRFAATHLGLRGLLVHLGDRVRRGQRIGRVGPAGVIRLGARLSTERFGWVDPLALVARERPRGAPLGPAPPPAARGASPRLGPRPAPRPIRRRIRRRAPIAHRIPRRGPIRRRIPRRRGSRRCRRTAAAAGRRSSRGSRPPSSPPVCRSGRSWPPAAGAAAAARPARAAADGGRGRPIF
jgi:hypothetical protein